MSVLVLGLNYRSAPVSLLEKVAVPADLLPKALTSLLQREHITEAVVLSTCNRVEVYAHVTRYHGGMADLRDFFAEWSGLPPESFADLAYDHYEQSAAAHLFAVASGLDSFVVGERQIHMQVRQAFTEAEEHNSAGRVLSALFRSALRVGKRTRSETAISAGAATMVDVGLDAAGSVLGDLAGRTILVVGAGKMGGMAAARLRERGAGRILVANRTEEKSERLAGRIDGELVRFGELTAGLSEADLVLTSTGSPQPLIDREIVAEAMAGRAERAMVLLDLAVPRDVDPGSGAVPGVTVLDVDAVRALTDRGVHADEVVKARAIVDGEAEKFAGWTRAARVEPTIAALRVRAEIIRQAEIQRSGARLGDLDARQQQALEALTKRIVNTLLHDPTVRLKALADAHRGEHEAAALRELFDLPEQ